MIINELDLLRIFIISYFIYAIICVILIYWFRKLIKEPFKFHIFKKILKTSFGIALFPLLISIIVIINLTADRSELFEINNDFRINRYLIISNIDFIGYHLSTGKNIYILNNCGLGVRYYSVVYGKYPKNYEATSEIIKHGEILDIQHMPEKIFGKENSYIWVKKDTKSAVRYYIDL